MLVQAFSLVLYELLTCQPHSQYLSGYTNNFKEFWSNLWSKGFSGTILPFWDKKSFECLGIEVGALFISCYSKNIEDGYVLVS